MSILDCIQVLPARVALTGIRRIGFGVLEGRCPEDQPFPSALSSCLEFCGEGLGYSEVYEHGKIWSLNETYVHLMGVSGAAFRLLWRAGWHEDNVDLSLVSEQPLEPFTRAFAAAGYEPVFVHRVPGHDNEARFRDDIVRSIREHNMPALAFGVVGPPECCMICGYDEGGEVLLGWNYFQDQQPFNAEIDIDETGYFRKRDWYSCMHALLLFGAKRPKPRLRDTYTQTLDWALKLMHTQRVHDHFCGHAAYTTWAEQLLSDQAFASADLPQLVAMQSVHDDAVGTVAEGRWYASLFLKRAAQELKQVAKPLEYAAECFVREHDLMWQAWELLGGLGRGESHARKLGEESTRQQLARLIIQARDEDSQAGEAIAAALGS